MRQGREHLLLALLILAGCRPPNARVVTKLNASAALAGRLPYDPLHWQVLTIGASRTGSALFTLFGNDAVVEHARREPAKEVPAGSILALVTWRQQENIRWFGGQIAAEPQSVEMIRVTGTMEGNRCVEYQLFEGQPLQEKEVDEPIRTKRVLELLEYRAAVMP